MSDLYWGAICRLNVEHKNYEGLPKRIDVIVSPDFQVLFDTPCEASIFTVFFEKDEFDHSSSSILSSLFSVDTSSLTDLSDEDRRTLELYLPYSLLPYYSKAQNRCFAISHFAQTLDGRIASSSGDSKWIGNDENLDHSHRMRALCDGIVVGAKTVTTDNPRLNVRLVEGKDPIKIVLGGDDLETSSFKVFDEATLVYPRDSVGSTNSVNSQDEVCYDTKKILSDLYDKGIHSVYIEGGSLTTSGFLAQGSLDQVQLHLSPQILGSGTMAFSFDGVADIKDSIRFRDYRFMPVGGDMMFMGNI